MTEEEVLELATLKAVEAAEKVLLECAGNKVSILQHLGIAGRFVRAWEGGEGPIRVLRWGDMLDPVNASRFTPTISEPALTYIRAKAKENLEEFGDKPNGALSLTQIRWWQQIVTGTIPFGYKAPD